MPKLTKLEFAELVRSMPDASEEEILAEASRRETERQPGTLEKVWDAVRTPLIDAPARWAAETAEKLDRPSASGRPVHPLAAFGAGALQGAGQLVSQMTAPLDLAATVAGLGGAAAGRRGLLGISQAARNVEAGAMAPFVASGGYHVAKGLSEGDPTEAAMGAAEAAGGALGIAGAKTHSFPPVKVRDAYMKSQGRKLAPAAKVDKLNPEFSKSVADAYEAMPHTPDDPAVAAAYAAMADETSRQFQFLRDQAGVKMEPWTAEGQPYANSAEMMADVRDNNRLFYFPSEAGYGPDGSPIQHPLLKPGKSGAPVNDEFRAVHDYMGHAVEGHQFGPLGEERAYQAHRATMPEEAIPALTSETRGQNSWVNFGKHLRREDGSIPKKGEAGFVAPQERPFAEQKAGLLPEEFQRAEPSASAPKPASPGIETAGPSPSSQAYGLEDAAVKVGELTAQHGGATFNLRKGNLSGTPHYAVSVFPERGVVIEGQASPEAIAAFVQKNADLLENPENSIGTWFNKDDGKTYLDISVTKDNLDDALKLGQEKNQLAIFDLQNFEEIKVPQSGVTGSARAVTQMEEAPAEFHAVEARTGDPNPGFKSQPSGEPTQIPVSQGPQLVVDNQPLIDLQDELRTMQSMLKKSTSPTQQERLRHAINKTADEIARMKSGREIPRINPATSLSVASGAVVPFVGEDNILDFGDEDTNAMVRAGLGGLGLLGVGKVLAKAPAPKGVFKTDKGLVAVHPVTGRKVKIGVDALNSKTARPPDLTTQNIPDQWAEEFAKVGLKNGTPPPGKPLEALVSIRKGKLRYKPEVEARLRTLYRYGQEKFAAEGGAEWLENGIIDDMLMFLPVNKPNVVSQRLFAALSPATDVIGNLMDMIRVGLRAKKRHETGKFNLDPAVVKADLMKGVGNKPAKVPNVIRSLKGEALQSYAPPDPFPAGKVDDLAKGMAGELDAIPFDMWWARAIGLDRDAQPSNGFAYKVLFEAGADIARRNGEEPFPFMAKVWAAMKDLHAGGGIVAPNALARDIGLGQKDLFTGSTLPSGKAAQRMSKQIAQGGAELQAGVGHNARADKTVRQADEARHLLKVAAESEFKGLRTGRFNKMENAIKKQAYKRFVTDRGEGVSFEQGQADAAAWTSQQLSKLREKMEVSKEALGEHLTERLGKTELPLDTDNEMLLRRVWEILNPREADLQLYKQTLREAKKGTKDLNEPYLPSMEPLTRYLPWPPRK